MKTQFGGLKLGFRIVGYHVSTPAFVKVDDEYPTARQMITAIAIRVTLFISVFFLFKNSQKESLNHISYVSSL
jgi:hypothetical protein